MCSPVRLSPFFLHGVPYRIVYSRKLDSETTHLSSSDLFIILSPKVRHPCHTPYRVRPSPTVQFPVVPSFPRVRNSPLSTLCPVSLRLSSVGHECHPGVGRRAVNYCGPRTVPTRVPGWVPGSRSSRVPSTGRDSRTLDGGPTRLLTRKVGPTPPGERLVSARTRDPCTVRVEASRKEWEVPGVRSPRVEGPTSHESSPRHEHETNMDSRKVPVPCVETGET